MAGEIIKTKGVVLAIRPWSRTSHVVAWLTPDRGCVSTLVKGAVRAKSAFLGQYDLFYTCELLYYARANGDLHALREAVPLAMREQLRGRWRETSLAGYAAGLLKELVPSGSDASDWFAFLERFLDDLSATEPSSPDRLCAALIRLEMNILKLAGIMPDFSGMDERSEWMPFSLDSGRFGEGTRTVRLSPRTVAALKRPDASACVSETMKDAVRFLGVFLAYHLDTPPEVRRSLVQLVTSA